MTGYFDPISNEGPDYGNTAVVDVPPTTQSHDGSFADMIERLFRRFEGRLPLTTIVRIARESREQLSGSPAGAMPELTERLAIERLGALCLDAAAVGPVRLNLKENS